MNLRLLTLGILVAPAALPAQTYYASTSAYASSNTLPFNNTIESAQDSDGGAGFLATQSAAAISTGGAKSSSTSDLAKVTMTASAEAKGPAAGQRHYATAGANVNDYVNFARTGKDIVIPLKMVLSGLLTGTNLSTSGTFVAYDAFGPVTRIDLDLVNGRSSGETIWTIPASSTGRYYMTFQIGARAQSDAPQGDASVKGLKLQFKWDLPQGVAFTSESGVFSPDRITPVPEPASCVAAAVGLAALVRRRRSAL